MRHLLRNGFLIAAVLVLFVWAFMPPETKLRKGKDLAGGVSMVYSVRIDPNDDSKAVIARTIEVLKNRVDPDGLMEISMVAQGNDRIEISMPLPRDEVKVARKAFEDRLAQLGRARLTEARLQTALQAPAEERAKQLETFAAGSEVRKQRLADAAAAFDKATTLRAQYDAATDAAAKEAMLEEVAKAEVAYQAKRSEALATSLSANEIMKVVQSPTRVRYVEDMQTGQRVALPSPREVAESQLRNKYPEAKAEIDEILTLHAEYQKLRTTLDDPQDLIRMLKGAGVLSFRITPRVGQYPDEMRLRQELRAGGPKSVKSSDARFYRVNQIENWIDTKAEADALALDPEYARDILGRMGYIAEVYNGEPYMLCYDSRGSRLTKEEGGWAVASARQSFDERGRMSIAFEMTAAGAVKLGNLTREHVGEPMAVLLDDEVYTAPNLQSEISRSGQITGDFSKQEIDYIVRVLSGGSLQAKLSPEPISISSVGPELGQDNLEKGFRSGIISVIIVAVFMIGYYFTFGAVAVVSLAANAACIMGAMALSKASFTMPGIAGIILTFGTAVDSNVLVYERMREEFNRGADMKTAVRLGFDKALSAIVDGNVANLIVCVVLYYTGTPEIKGFAITMGIGVVATLFAALVVSRFIFEAMVAMGWRKASMLPMAIPQLQSWLTPNVDWMKYRFAFFTTSVILVSIGLGMCFVQGKKMLDNEFVGGTAVTITLKNDPSWTPPANDPLARPARITMKRADVEERVHSIGEGRADTDELSKLKNADVYPIDPEDDGVTSDRFTIKTLAKSDDSTVLLRPITEAFADVLETKPSLNYAGEQETNLRAVPAFPIDKPVLGSAVDRPDFRQDVSAYVGGVAIVLDNIDPAPTLDSLRDRLDTTRQSAGYSDTLARKRDIFITAGDETAVTGAVIVVADETASVFENEITWEAELRDREWRLVQDSLSKESTPASVQAFGAAIAETFRANATVATLVSFMLIGVYIWVRFKTPRYSLAAVVALVHDVLVVIGLVALAEILYESPATHSTAVALNLLPFKIDLNLVAALLTIAGYSLNDTVVIMDRIRENRGKLPHATREIINASINQTFSRTLITGGTTLFSCFVLYLIGGEGMRAFAFALATGLVVGTYSSIAVAAPIVWSRKHEEADHTAAQQA